MERFLCAGKNDDHTNKTEAVGAPLRKGERTMLLFEARNMVEKMRDRLPDGLAAREALTLALRCMEAQDNLTDLLNDLQADFKPEDSYSATLAAELLCEASIFKNEMREKFGLDPEDGDEDEDMDDSDK